MSHTSAGFMPRRAVSVKAAQPGALMHLSLVIAVVVALAGCSSQNKVAVVASPYGDGIEHTEPVFFTGRHYNVTFRYSAARSHYEVKVEGDGRALGNGPGDRQIVEQVASSALSHFACPARQRAQIVAGSTSAVAGAWVLQARCA